jgi:cell division protein FtsW
MIYEKADKWLFVITFFLVGFGALMVFSSTSVVMEQGVSEYYYLKKHLFTIAVSLTAMLIAYRTKLSWLKKMAIPLLIVSFILLALVFVPGVGVSAGGAKRWIRLWPSTFQPSEFVRLAMVIFLARYMSIKDYRTDRFIYFFIPVAVMALFQGVFLMQPDFGATMSLGVLTLCMLFLSGTRLRYIVYLLALGAPVVVKLALEPYRLRRITAFLDPWNDAMGSGFQLVQSFMAFGRGGIVGVGLGNSRQKLDFLPEVHTDFIFSMVGEEVGFMAAAMIVILFALLFWRGLKVALKNKDGFEYYLAFGLSMMLALQALVNFWVVTGLLPTKGLPLPFLSYGGSSLLVNMTAVGFLLNLSRPVVRVEQGRDDLSEIIKRKRARRSVYGGSR